MKEQPILVAGFPRSGTTWVARILGETRRVKYVHEPDNDRLDPYALNVKRSLGRFPALSEADEHRGYETLWRGALGGGEASRSLRARLAWRILNATDRDVLSATVGRTRATPFRLRVASSFARPHAAGGHDSRMIVKTVHAPLALDWIFKRFDVRCITVLRHPLNALASWVDLSLPDADRRLDEDARVKTLFLDRWAVGPPARNATALERSAWHVGLFSAALLEHLERHQDALLIRHETFCTDPAASFRQLADTLDLKWTDDAESFLHRSDRAGRGFTPERMTAEQPYRWQRTFVDPDDVALVRRVLTAFPQNLWSEPPRS